MDVSVILTYRCASRYAICCLWENPTDPEGEVSLATLAKIPSGIDCLKLTGGEPTLPFHKRSTLHRHLALGLKVRMRTPIRRVFDCLSAMLRKSKLEPVLSELRAGRLVIDVGVWCSMPEPHVAENWLEKQDPGQGRIVAIGLSDMTSFRRVYPSTLCVQADGCALPFPDRSVDIAAANAVLEHVPLGNQPLFVSEMVRVVRGRALIAVPDRLCPVEVHSRLPLVHWLPCWRGVLKLLGAGYWSDDRHLASLFSRNSLLALLHRATRGRGKWSVARQWLLLIPVSLIAIYRPNPSSEAPVASDS